MYTILHLAIWLILQFCKGIVVGGYFLKKREKEKWRITLTRIIIQPQLSSLAGKKWREPFKLSSTYNWPSSSGWTRRSRLALGSLYNKLEKKHFISLLECKMTTNFIWARAQTGMQEIVGNSNALKPFPYETFGDNFLRNLGLTLNSFTSKLLTLQVTPKKEKRSGSIG